MWVTGQGVQGGLRSARGSSATLWALPAVPLSS